MSGFARKKLLARIKGPPLIALTNTESIVSGIEFPVLTAYESKSISSEADLPGGLKWRPLYDNTPHFRLAEVIIFLLFSIFSKSIWMLVLSSTHATLQPLNFSQIIKKWNSVWDKNNRNMPQIRASLHWFWQIIVMLLVFSPLPLVTLEHV